MYWQHKCGQDHHNLPQGVAYLPGERAVILNPGCLGCRQTWEAFKKSPHTQEILTELYGVGPGIGIFKKASRVNIMFCESWAPVWSREKFYKIISEWLWAVKEIQERMWFCWWFSVEGGGSHGTTGPPGDVWQHLETCSVVITGGKVLQASSG